MMLIIHHPNNMQIARCKKAQICKITTETFDVVVSKTSIYISRRFELWYGFCSSPMALLVVVVTLHKTYMRWMHFHVLIPLRIFFFSRCISDSLVHETLFNFSNSHNVQLQICLSQMEV